jgi:hypothetical protein
MCADGHRLVLGYADGDNMTESFSPEFLTCPVATNGRNLQCSAWQRCRMHVLRNDQSGLQ